MFLKGNGLSLVICAAALMGCAELGSTLVIGDQGGGQEPSEATDASDTDDPAEASDTSDPSTLDEPATVLCRYHVAPEASENGESWEMPSDLRAALSNLAGHLAQGDCESGEVWIKTGTYTPGSDPDDSFELSSGMTLYGGFSGNETTVGQRNLSQQTSTLSGDLENDAKAIHVVSIVNQSSSEVRLDGLTIQGGAASGSGAQSLGGGLYALESRIRLVNVSFVSNEALSGGALAMEGGVLSVERGRFVSNTASADGGALFILDAALLVTGLEMVSNTADRGGGLFLQNAAEVRLENTQWLTHAARLGGAVFESGGASFILTRAQFQSNQGFESGGALYLALTSAPLIGNATFFDNAAPHGACLFADSIAQVSIAGLTMTGNLPGTGGSLEAVGSAVAVVNSILWNNTREIATGAGGTVSVAWSIAPETVTGDNLIAQDPLFVRGPGEVFGTDPNLALQAGSSAVDSGNNNLIPEGLGGTDAAGMGRRRDDATVADSGEGDAPIVDRGAFER